MITDALNASFVHPPRKDRNAAMFDTMMTTLRSGGSVLLPTDSSARVLELAYLLDKHWAQNQLTYPLIMLTNTSYHTAHFAKIMLEWMGDDLTQHFSQTRENPFDFKYLRLCHKLEDIDVYTGPKVVIASNNSLETGFARDLFLRWMGEERPVTHNTLILTDRSAPGSLARQLYDAWDKRTQATTTGDDKRVIKPAIDYNESMHMTVYKRVPLEGEELAEYEERQREQAERDAAQAAIIARSKSIMEEDELSDESDMDEADDTMEDLLGDQFDLYVKDAGRSGGFFKQAQSYRMFPYLERRKKIDDYGESIQIEHYMKASDLDRLQMEKGEENAEGANFGKEEDMVIDAVEPLLPGKDEKPMKYITTEQDVEIQCQLRYVDLEGLSDGRSMKTILPQIAPRKLVYFYIFFFFVHWEK